MLYIEIEVNPGPFQLRKTLFMRSLSSIVIVGQTIHNWIRITTRSIKAHPYFPIRNKQKWLAKGIVYYKRYWKRWASSCPRVLRRSRPLITFASKLLLIVIPTNFDNPEFRVGKICKNKVSSIICQLSSIWEEVIAHGNFIPKILTFVITFST